jgi:CHAD domain-containing protein
MDILGNTPLWVAAGIVLQDRADDFYTRLKRTARTLEHEDIHDLRVSSRRLREALVLLAPCYNTRRINHLRKKARSITRLLGEIRNTDEAILFFTGLAPEFDGENRQLIDDIITSHRKRRKKDQVELKRGLHALDAQSLREYFTKTLNSPCLYNPPVTGFDPFIAIAEYARITLSERLATVLAHVPDARQEDKVIAQHMLRIAVKRYRYCAELFNPLFKDGYAECHSVIKEYQDTLGVIHDLDVFAGLVKGHIADHTAAEPILKVIGSRRHALYCQFSEKLDSKPLHQIGHRLESLL